MEYYDIVFEGLSCIYLDKFFRHELKISCQNVINSHLYDRRKGDLEYYDELEINNIFSYDNTGNIYVGCVSLDKEYSNVLVLIVSDEIDVEITLNISTDQINVSKNKQMYAFFKKIIKTYKLKCIYICEENGTKDHALFYLE